MNFEHLVVSCISQNRRAQKELFYCYSKQLMATAYRYTQEHAAAEDVVQESFIKIYYSIAQLKQRDELSLLAWMKKITVREAFKWLKKNKSFQAQRSNAVAQRNVGEDVLSNEDVLKIIYELPEGFQQIIQLYIIDGFSHKEIAEMLEISESTSRSQLSRGRALFIEKWTQISNYYGQV